MSTVVMLITMSSVFLGFLLFGGAFVSFRYAKPPALVWSLFAASLVFTTLIPVIIAVFIASR